MSWFNETKPEDILDDDQEEQDIPVIKKVKDKGSMSETREYSSFKIEEDSQTSLDVQAVEKLVQEITIEQLEIVKKLLKEDKGDFNKVKEKVGLLQNLTHYLDQFRTVKTHLASLCKFEYPKKPNIGK